MLRHVRVDMPRIEVALLLIVITTVRGPHDFTPTRTNRAAEVKERAFR